jgi:hypothetical protein
MRIAYWRTEACEFIDRSNSPIWTNSQASMMGTIAQAKQLAFAITS